MYQLRRANTPIGPKTGELNRQDSRSGQGKAKRRRVRVSDGCPGLESRSRDNRRPSVAPISARVPDHLPQGSAATPSPRAEVES